ncbi:Uncharacterized protein OBRU01_21524, partial [Operophtera brumata]
MQLQGRNLAELRRAQPRGAFSLSTTLRQGARVPVHRVRPQRALQLRVYHDMPPLSHFQSNFSIGRHPANCRKVYMLDFGLARQYTTSSGQVRPPRAAAGFRGNPPPPMASPQVPSASAGTPRTVARCTCWTSGWRGSTPRAVGRCAPRAPPPASEVTLRPPWHPLKYLQHRPAPRELSQELRQFLEHVQQLEYADTPDYSMLTSLLERCCKRRGIRDTDPYDWEKDAVGLIKSHSISEIPGEIYVGNH